MVLKIRLRQQGRKNRRFYRLVLTDSRSPRDGKYKETVGWYNPREDKENLNISADRVQYWINQGAVVTEKAATLIRRCCPDVIKFQQKKLSDRLAKACEKRKLAKKKKVESK